MKKSIVFFLSLILCFLLIPTIISFPLKKTVFSTNYYQDVVKENFNFSFFSKSVISSILDSVQENEPSGMTSSLINAFSRSELENFLFSMLPIGWVETQTNEVVNKFVDYLNFKSTELVTIIDLQPIKDTLISDSGKQALYDLISTLPSCTFDQINLYMTAFNSGDFEGLPLCNPPVSDITLLDPLLTPVLISLSQSIPQTYAIPDEEQTTQLNELTQTKYFSSYKLFRQAIPYLIWICLGFIFLIILLSVKNIRFLLISLAFPISIAGLISGLLGFILSSGLPRITSLVNSQYLELTNSELFSQLNNILLKIIGDVAQIVMIYSLVAVVLGLILFVISRFIKKATTF